jgi:hydroxylamine reductase (hybrid-cluster protein)
VFLANGQALAVGATNLKVMKLLSETHSSKFGNPTPTDVSLTPRPGKAILITGHDMQACSHMASSLPCRSNITHGSL